jgi:hypothetical protein
LIATVINGQFRGVVVIHAVYILAAVVLAHIISRRWQNNEAKIRGRNHFFGIVAILALLSLAVIVVAQGVGFAVG